MHRPDFEKMYKLLYRKHHELLNALEDTLQKYAADDTFTATDLAGTLAGLHGQHVAHDWEN